MMSRNIRQKVLGLGLLLASLCSAAVAQDDAQAREQSAQVVATSFMQQLSGALQRELVKGPAEATSVCRELAPQLAGLLSRQNGWQVTRVGTRVRNPLLGLPDAWERKVLDDFERRRSNGEDLATMSHGELVEFEGRREYRYMKAIGLQPACVICHGSSEQIPESVQNSLEQSYPHDEAVGYAIGDLRGAVSIRQPIE
jgi:hypothetical protein